MPLATRSRASATGIFFKLNTIVGVKVAPSCAWAKQLSGWRLSTMRAERPNWNKFFRNDFSWSQMQAVIDTHSLNNYQ
jgi:hypothetical protein